MVRGVVGNPFRGCGDNCGVLVNMRVTREVKSKLRREVPGTWWTTEVHVICCCYSACHVLSGIEQDTLVI